ncbi:uncharacterized protein GGS22DRAFT_166165 [Annulohypoxylon maeteangense]|uniref:uncharacterized protein n=1 Tax=Annulohypoxylon maeteangense TaxID=1927788 RepID=UPI0020078415|nr:uncharacterized protein GGS22DRAFT_166165 [Annulohypoxylon maeteangense]KAI0883823.1 hypothetical protein GGS22DRAFT_166165 [Annulohypoxylon maeteangense]
MSRFSTYCEWTVTARKCLDGEPPPDHLATFHLWRGLIQFPLIGVAHSSRIACFYKGLVAEVDQSRLDDKRKELYRKFTARVISAHVAVEGVGAPFGTVSNLRKPLCRLAAALEIMVALKEYDDDHPIHWSEVFPTEDAPCSMSPQDLWLHFKLKSIRPCLIFLVRILRLLLPGYSEWWNECEESFRRKQWMLLFVLDSPTPRKIRTPA